MHSEIYIDEKKSQTIRKYHSDAPGERCGRHCWIFFDIKSENARHKWRIITIFNQEIVVNSQCINCRLDQTPLVRSTQRRTHTQNAYWNTEAKMVYTRHTTTATTTTNPKKTRQLYREESVAVTQIHIRFFFVDFCSLSFLAVRCVDMLSKRTKFRYIDQLHLQTHHTGSMTFHIIIACKIIYKWCVTHSCSELHRFWNVKCCHTNEFSTYDHRQLVQRCIERADRVQDLGVPVSMKKRKIEERKNRESLVWFVHWNRSTKEIREEIHHSSKLPTGHDKFHRVTFFFIRCIINIQHISTTSTV